MFFMQSGINSFACKRINFLSFIDLMQGLNISFSGKRIIVSKRGTCMPARIKRVRMKMKNFCCLNTCSNSNIINANGWPFPAFRRAGFCSLTCAARHVEYGKKGLQSALNPILIIRFLNSRYWRY